MKFEILTVAEDDYESDRFTAAQKNYHHAGFSWNPGRRSTPIQECKELRFSLDVKRSLMIRKLKNGKMENMITFEKVDIDGLIEYLQEVKQFLSEEELVAKLLGKKKIW
jgi:hypothetical protein